jgi:hypothetical protein
MRRPVENRFDYNFFSRAKLRQDAALDDLAGIVSHKGTEITEHTKKIRGYCSKSMFFIIQ